METWRLNEGVVFFLQISKLLAGSLAFYEDAGVFTQLLPTFFFLYKILLGTLIRFCEKRFAYLYFFEK